MKRSAGTGTTSSSEETPTGALGVTQPESNPGSSVPSGQNHTGKIFGDFRIQQLIGEGGMGQVYRAEQISLSRPVALKVLKPELAAQERALKRFKLEAESVAKLSHANIVQVYFHGEHEGIHYMALEFVDGRTLRDYLARKGPIDLPLGLSIMRQVAAALQRAGELGIAHRDIKPENILVTRKGEVKVADFGLSRDETHNLSLTQSGIALGTPLYMSPEQVQAKPIDPRTDIYSFGVTCYQMFAGNPPFVAQSVFDLALKHVSAAPTPLHEIRPDLPPALCTLVEKMMAKNPDDRVQNGREILREIAAVRANISGPGPTMEWSGRSNVAVQDVTEPIEAVSVEPVRRWKRWAIAAGALLMALIVGIALGRKDPRPPNPGQPHVPPTSGVPIVPLNPEPLPELFEEEKRLRENAGLYPRPAVREVKLGVDHRIEYLCFLIKKNRLADAAAFCDELGKQAPPYASIADIGRAIVLAQQGKAADSNNTMLEYLRRHDFPPPPPRPAQMRVYPLLNHHELGKLLTEAMCKNRDSAPAAFPHELDPLTLPPQDRPWKWQISRMDRFPPDPDIDP